MSFGLDLRHRLGLSVSLGVCLGLGLGFSRGLVQPAPLHAQAAVRSVTLAADLVTDDGSAIVTVAIDVVPDDTATLRIELLEFGRATTDGFRAGGPDGPLIRFDRRSGRRVWVEVRPDDFDGILAADGRIVASYVIRNARFTTGESVRVHIPVLTVAVPPVRDAGDVFHADIRVPTTWAVSERFPTGLRATSDGGHAVDLAVAPSVISLRARTDGAWRPGVPLLLDLLAAMILLTFLVFGWRHLRASASAGGSSGVAFETGDAPPAPTGDRD